MKTKTHCSFCGNPLVIEILEGKPRQLCIKCQTIHYENPLPAASVVLPNKQREILLVKREREPYEGMWCMPIGFAETGESIENAALRELKEETGVDGKIIQLIDVSSHKNPLYGDLLIVTFEAEKVGGTEQAGDDALECRYFPIKNLPKLAFDSQEKAILRFVELKKDLWNIYDSLETFFEGAVTEKTQYAEGLLSDELIGVVEAHSGRIIDLWIDDIYTNPSTRSYRNIDRENLFSRAIFIIGQFGAWLKGIRGEEEFKDFYYSLGRERNADGIPMEELVSSLSLLKKHIWMFTYSFGVWEKAVDIYRMFELGERLVYFFDKALYHTVTGYIRK